MLAQHRTALLRRATTATLQFNLKSLVQQSARSATSQSTLSPARRGSLLGTTISTAAAPAAAAMTTGSHKAEEFYPHGTTSLTPATNMSAALGRLGQRFEEVALSGPSQYVKPASITYEFDGKQRRWDIMHMMPSVGIVLYHKERDAFLLVRQFRPALLATLRRDAQAAGQPKPPFSAGFTYELCAGLIDKESKSMFEIAQEEIHEECGYNVPADSIQRIGSSLVSAGTSGSEHVLFFAQVDDSMRVDDGGGLPSTGECIEVLSLPFNSTEDFVLDSALPKTPGLMFGLFWCHQRLLSGALGSRQKSAGKNGLETGELTLQPVLTA